MAHRVLLVDDDPAWLDLAAFHFEGRGLDVTPASSAREAELLLGQRDFDAVITDVSMPDEDGWSFRRRIRSTPLGQRLPIALLSGSAEFLSRGVSARPLFDKAMPLPDLADEVERLARNARSRSEAAEYAHPHSQLRMQELVWRLRKRTAPAVRRALDLVGASLGLALLFPLILIIAMAIRLEDRGPVLFVQERAGRGGRRFKLLKFRSMFVNAEHRKAELTMRNEHRNSITFKMREDPRITRVGRLLRRSSLDELPQLWNVLRGEMSLVGPRPPTPDEVCRYGSEAWRRLDVTPGLTGLWQVSGRGDLDFEAQLALDVRYIQERSVLGDLKLILMTIPAVLTGRGAY
jgi:lipopolysaccharide/colanic/teichoic acid biosynthesis glycosyltransferase